MTGKYALIVGNTEYTDPGLAQLTAPGKDAEDFARVLQDKDICAFGDVRVLLNEPEYIVRRTIDEFFDEKKPDDLLVLYFSGHGVRDELGSLYLAVKNTIRHRLRSTAIKSDYIREAMDQSRSKRQVLILDCCNSGAFAQGAKAELGGAMGMVSALQGRGRFILTASDATQFAWEGNTVIGETQNSLFTHFLIKGLEGEADRDGDGRITIDELYDYAHDQISNLTPKQTPTKSVSIQEGEIVLRQFTRLEDIKPVSLSDQLISEIENPYPEVRLRAVAQLAKLVTGKNLGLARSAREALERLEKEDDSRRVSQAAMQVLESIRQEEKKADEERKARQEAERLAALKAEEESLAREKAEAERKAKEESERLLAKEMAEEAERIALLKAEQDRIARERADFEQKTKEEAERLSARKAEEDRLAAEKAKAEREAKEESEREFAKRVESEAKLRAALEEIDRKAAERSIREKAETERKAKGEAERIAEERQLDGKRAEAVRKAKITERLAKQKMEEEQVAEARTETEHLSSPRFEQEPGKNKSHTNFRRVLVGFGLLIIGAIVVMAVVAYNNEMSSRRYYAARSTDEARSTDKAQSTTEARSTAEARRETTAEAQKQNVLAQLEKARTWPLVLADDFSTDNPVWFPRDLNTDPLATGNRLIIDGKYRWDVKAIEGFSWRDVISLGSKANFYLTVEATRISGTRASGFDYGLVIRADDNNNYYSLLIDSDDSWKFYRRYDGNSTLLKSDYWGLRIQDGTVNRLAIIADGSHFAFFINDQYVGEADDNQVSGEKVGIIVGLDQADDEAIFEFDNFELRSPEVIPAVATPTPIFPLLPENTPTIAVGAATVTSCYGLSFVSDVTIPDNTPIAAGQSFTKTWKVKNSGSCSWDAGFKFVFVGGEQMGGTPYTLQSPVAAGAVTDISIAMVAPNKRGTLRGNWRMSTGSGQFFGDEIYLQIVVGGGSTPSIATPTSFLLP